MYCITTTFADLELVNGILFAVQKSICVITTSCTYIELLSELVLNNFEMIRAARNEDTNLDLEELKERD